MRIRPAAESDLNAVAQSYRNLLMHEMEQPGYSNWKFGVYPTMEVSTHAHARRELYVAETRGQIIGSMILTETQPKEYATIDWTTEDAEKVLVMHTLCIPPRHSGKGHGHALVRYAIELASEAGYDVIRCNLWDGNLPAKSVLDDMGFVLAGSGTFKPDSLPEETDLFMECDLHRSAEDEF